MAVCSMFYASLSLSPSGAAGVETDQWWPWHAALQAEALAVYHLLSEGEAGNNFPGICQHR